MISSVCHLRLKRIVQWHNVKQNYMKKMKVLGAVNSEDRKKFGIPPYT